MGAKMRNDKAVSEILGAVILIGLVVTAITIIGVMMVPSTVSKIPVTTTGSYCVKCSESKYEIYVRHEGGDSFPQEGTKIEVLSESGVKKDIPPSELSVYTGATTPVECTASSGQRKTWDTVGWFGPGQVLEYDYDPSNYGNSEPAGVVITSGGTQLNSLTFETIKNSTESNDRLVVQNPGEITPMVTNVSVTNPDAEGYCTATFYYINKMGVRLGLPPCNNELLVVDEEDNPLIGTSCPKPWNQFVGVVPTGADWTKRDWKNMGKNMGQPTLFEPNEADGMSKTNRSFDIKFKNAIQWNLGNLKVKTDFCPVIAVSSTEPPDCGSNEAYMWGHVFYDINKNGLMDANESALDLDGISITLVGRDKNNPNTVVFTDTYKTKSGIWYSRCIHMSGWAYDLSVVIPSGYSTSTPISYPNYDEKFTGQEKKNPPRIDFGVYLPVTPVPTVVPIDYGGVGAQLYAADSTSNVTVDFAFSDAGFTNVFSLSGPRTIPLGYSQGTPPNNRVGTPFGTTWNLGNFSTGQELIFADTADGKTYRTGPKSRNPDNFYHGAVTLKNPNGTYHKYLVSFEDYHEGGDKDYNDVEFYVNGNLYVQSVPTPAPTATPVPDIIAPTVSIISPTKWTSWNKQTRHDIVWSASDNVGVVKVDIWYSKDDGLSNKTIIKDITNTGRYAWNIPNIKGDKMKIIVTAYDAAENPGTGISGTFSITNN
ncbi:MAG TPA: type IV pilin [Methanospirillum sp.]|nr:type IV pilin [Methanospirillum sp.]